MYFSENKMKSFWSFSLGFPEVRSNLLKLHLCIPELHFWCNCGTVAEMASEALHHFKGA